MATPRRYPLHTVGAAPAEAQPAADPAAPAARPVELVIHAEYAGWPVDLAVTLPAEKVGQALDRLAALGYKPRAAALGAPASPSARPTRPAPVEPLYRADGAACCPVHKRPLVEGAHGLYCPARADTAAGELAGPKGYCALRFSTDR